MTIEPDIQGFLDAQNRLRKKMGQDVDFMLRVPPEWPDHTPLNDSGVPYDPTIAPVSGGDLQVVTKRVGVVFKPESPTRPGADTRWSQAGEMANIDAILDLDASDYADVQTAVQVWLNTLKFKIEEWKPSGLGDLRRWSVYLAEL